MMLTVSSTDAVTLKVDPSIVLATRQYVDSAVIEVKTYADNVMKKHVAAENPHSQYPLIKNALKELADAGLVGEVLKNLGLGEGSALPVGIPVPCPSVTPPTGWLKCNGAAFDKVKYPALALAFPSGILPDLRGEFIRGWDDGRGVDADRSLLTSQGDAIRNITASLCDLSANSGVEGTTGAAYISWRWGSKTNITTGSTSWGQYNLVIDASRQVPTANENRPRNVAFNYIVRAA